MEDKSEHLLKQGTRTITFAGYETYSIYSLWLDKDTWKRYIFIVID